MSSWNPHNKRFLYFHCTYGPDDGLRADYYLKVDTFEQTVLKVCHETFKMDRKNQQAGIYILKWSTFITKHGNELRIDSIKHTRKCEKGDGYKRFRIKYTTETQFQDALISTVEHITKMKVNIL